MKKIGLILLASMVLLALASPAAASAPTGFIGIYSVAACHDTATVAVSGTASAATNRIKAWIYRQNSQGEWIYLANTITPNFSGGDFIMPLVLDYFGDAVGGGTPLQVVVKLQSRYGSSFVDVSSTSTFLNAADKTCQNKCSVTISTTDIAPADGVITVRSHYGSFFRPEGWLHSAMPVAAGQRPLFSVVGAQPLWLFLPAGRLAAQRHARRSRPAPAIFGGRSALQLDRARVVLSFDGQRSHAQNAARTILAQ
jgi:hypothetical protein